MIDKKFSNLIGLGFVCLCVIFMLFAVLIAIYGIIINNPMLIITYVAGTGVFALFMGIIALGFGFASLN